MSTTPTIVPPITLPTEGFITRWWHAFVGFFKKNPSWVHVAQMVLPYAVLIANAALTVVDPALIAIAAPIEAEVQADLATVATLTASSSATPSLTDAVNRLKANFATIAAELHLKDPATVASVNTVVTQLDLLLNILAPATLVPVDPAPAVVS